MSTLNDSFQFSKGAIDKIIPICKYYLIDGKEKLLDNEVITRIYKLHDDLTLNGLRIIAFAYKKTKVKNTLV